MTIFLAPYKFETALWQKMTAKQLFVAYRHTRNEMILHKILSLPREFLNEYHWLGEAAQRLSSPLTSAEAVRDAVISLDALYGFYATRGKISSCEIAKKLAAKVLLHADIYRGLHTPRIFRCREETINYILIAYEKNLDTPV